MNGAGQAGGVELATDRRIIDSLDRSDPMAKSETIIIRVDPETKRRFEEAAEGLGLSLTTFLLRAAEAAAGVAAKRRAKAGAAPTPGPPEDLGRLPGLLQGDLPGGPPGRRDGYDWAGRKLIRSRLPS